MCYDVGYLASRAAKEEERFKSRYEDADILEKLKKIQHVSGFSHPELPVITNERRNIIEMMQWGLIPFWVKDDVQAKQSAINCLNAVSETAFEKPSFRDSIGKRRCIVIVDGFYEWFHLNKKDKYPHFITLKDEGPIALGGTWTTWTNKITGEEKRTFSILTTEANPLMAKIHNSKKRMPFIIPDELIDKWLSSELSKQEINELMGPFDEQQMKAHSIKKFVRGAVMDEMQLPYSYSELEGVLELKS